MVNNNTSRSKPWQGSRTAWATNHSWCLWHQHGSWCCYHPARRNVLLQGQVSVHPLVPISVFCQHRKCCKTSFWFVFQLLLAQLCSELLTTAEPHHKLLAWCTHQNWRSIWKQGIRHRLSLQRYFIFSLYEPLSENILRELNNSNNQFLSFLSSF